MVALELAECQVVFLTRQGALLAILLGDPEALLVSNGETALHVEWWIEREGAVEAKLEAQRATEDYCLLRFEDRVHLLTIEAKQESCVVRVILVLLIPVGRGEATEPPLGILSLTKD